MAWYYWLYVAIAIEWFLVNYGSLVQPPARQNVWLVLLAYPIIASVAEFVWPLELLTVLIMARKERSK